MISTTRQAGAISFEYTFNRLGRQVTLHTLYDAKTMKSEGGKLLYDDIAITEDEYELIHPFYGELHTELFPVLSTVLLRDDLNTDRFNLQATNPNYANIVWNIADGTTVVDGETVADEYYLTHHLFQPNMATILDKLLESAYKYYALYKWFLSINTVPVLAQKYHTLYTDELSKIRSAVRHNNNADKRPKLKQNPF